MLKKTTLTACALYALTSVVFAQTKTNHSALARTAQEHKQQEVQNFQKALLLAKKKGWEPSFKTKDGNIAMLIGVDNFGLPIYYTTENSVAAATTGASRLWSGGSSGLNLSGSSANMKNKMALWDGGAVLASHVEINNRIDQRDNAPTVSEHSTHVAGTMIGAGINPLAKGMAYGSQGILAFSYANDASEMSSVASGLLLSNHSYGSLSGWNYNEPQNRWEFWGRPNENEDYKFGFYDASAQMFDSIAYNAPNYLIVKSSGNTRDMNGPAVGQTYYRYDQNGQMTSAGPRPSGISSNNGYDIIPTAGTAKNILTVGAVNGLPYGYIKKEDVVISTFSSWGPTDDGRIKPDIVADGVEVLSSVSSSNNSYARFSGTSMSAPNATGSLFLLQEYYAQLHSGAFMRSATLKALAIHTADEAGMNPGPDYVYGWGLLNVAKAAEVIKSKNTGSNLIYEYDLANGSTFTTDVVASGKGSLVATIVWTDPKGTVETIGVLNNTTAKLINDLDIRITKGSTVFKPWTLDPSVPSAAATQGDNVLDNVERINIDNVIPGETYTIQVSHKGNLQRGNQAYTLVISGVGGQAYCSSAPSANNGTRIEEVSFGSINMVNASGCTTYNNYTSLSTPAEPGQSIPLTVKVGSCDATTADKVVKVFIDFNNNGNFTDAGELVATSGVITGAGTFTGNVYISSTVSVGSSTIMRVVAQETSTASDVNPCGSYSKGETQDFKITFVAPSNDLTVLEVIAPETGDCASPSQIVAVRIKNNGIAPKTNIPVTVTVRNGTAVVANYSTNFNIAIAPNNASVVNFPLGFATTAGTTYSVTASVNARDDQFPLNDTARTEVVIPSQPAAPSGAAVEICGSTLNFRVQPANETLVYQWYDSPTASNPVSIGANGSLNTTSPASTYYVSTGWGGKAGLINKNQHSSGGYMDLAGGAHYMNYSSTAPLRLESARLYIGNPGKVTFSVITNVTQTATGFQYNMISSKTIDVFATTPTPTPGSKDGNNPADTGFVYYLGIDLPPGNHAIMTQTSGGATIFRNNNITAAPYPITSGNGIFSFTGNSAVMQSDPNYFQGYYYYLYDLNLMTYDCKSQQATVVPTTQQAPVISANGNVLTSNISGGVTFQWYLNNNPVSGANPNSFTATENGLYSLGIQTSSGCILTSNTVNVTTTALPDVNPQEIGLKVIPNAAASTLQVQFTVQQKADLSVAILNMSGQTLYTQNIGRFSGNYNKTIAIPQLTSGVYLVHLVHNGKQYKQKLAIVR
jgi:hypothetical protein